MVSLNSEYENKIIERTKKFIDEERNLIREKHWTKILEILYLIKENYDKKSILDLIRQNEDIVKTYSIAKSNIKKIYLLVRLDILMWR